MGCDDDRYRHEPRAADLRRDDLRQDHFRREYLREDLRSVDIRQEQIDWEIRRAAAAHEWWADKAHHQHGRELAKSGNAAGLAGSHGLDYRPTSANHRNAFDGFPALALANVDLFPLNGVTLGRTTVVELSTLGHRSRYIDDQTGEPFRCYQVDGINFWYLDGDVAESVFLAHGTAIPEKWRKLGVSWAHSYNRYEGLLRLLGFEVTVTRQPTTRWFSGRRSFSAELEGRRQAAVGLRIKLDFDFGDGVGPDDIDTLYSIDVAVTE